MNFDFLKFIEQTMKIIRVSFLCLVRETSHISLITLFLTLGTIITGKVATPPIPVRAKYLPSL